MISSPAGSNESHASVAAACLTVLFSNPGITTTDVIQAFAGRDTAMMLYGDWQRPILTQQARLQPGRDYGVFILPGMTRAGDRPLIVEARPFLLGKGSVQAKDALNVADVLMRDRLDNSNRWSAHWWAGRGDRRPSRSGILGDSGSGSASPSGSPYPRFLRYRRRQSRDWYCGWRGEQGSRRRLTATAPGV
jgi:hypothetical protein